MGGADAVRGIGYQQAQAVLEALSMLDDAAAAALRVEGVEDVIDTEILDGSAAILRARQFKIRAEPYTWSRAQLIDVLMRWAAVAATEFAEFEFVTDGRLGPSGEHVASALDAASEGDRTSLATLLGMPPDGPVCRRLSRASIRRDQAGVGALLLRAERQVAAMLPGARTGADLAEQSVVAVNRLFALLIERAGNADPDGRLVSRHEITAILGVSDELRPSHRWAQSVRDRYLVMAAGLDVQAITTLRVVPEEDLGSRTDVGFPGPISLVEAGGVAILAGPTGTGKSSTAAMLRRDAAVAARPVLVAHAEAYLPGRLDALAADAISDVIGEPMPTWTGRQALADSTVTLVLDGASEVPVAVRSALAEDLRAPLAAGHGAKVLLIGRDVAALRALLPTSVTPTVFYLSELDVRERYDVARKLMGKPPLASGEDPGDPMVRAVVARAEAALQDAVGNPLLFTVAVRLLAAGVSFKDRAALYAGFVEQLAARSGTTGVVVAARGLGVAFARLLDEGRRYADPYEWAGLLQAAAESLAIGGVDGAAIGAAAFKSGLVNSLGYTQTVVPLHDSIADYLAGAAHAAGAVAVPTSLTAADEQRIAFAAEIGGIDARLAALVARDLPFLAVRLADCDHRGVTDSAPEEVALLLRRLLPAGQPAAALWRDHDRVVAFRGLDPSWLGDSTARELVGTAAAVVSPTGSPLDIAVRVWRQTLGATLAARKRLAPPLLRDAHAAAATLTEFAEATAQAITALVTAIAPPGAAPVLFAQIGPAGLTALVSDTRTGRRGFEWSVSYRHTDVVDVRVDKTGRAAEFRPGWGSSSVESLVADGPEVEASKRVTQAINRLAGRRWL